MKILLCICYVTFSIFGTTLIKVGTNIRQDGALFSVKDFYVSYQLILGILCYGCSFLLYTLVVSRLQISLVIPVLSAINIAALVIVGLVVFAETLNKGQIVGIAILVIGVLVTGIYSLR